jgi:hypothetical protein
MTDTIESLRAELAAEREKRERAEAEVESLRALADRLVFDAPAEQANRAASRRIANLTWDLDAALLAMAEKGEAGAREAEKSLALFRERDAALDRLLAIEREARALLEALPKCDVCGKPATRAWERGKGRWCDEHAPSAPAHTETSLRLGVPDRSVLMKATEYPRAAPLRALVALFGEVNP